MLNERTLTAGKRIYEYVYGSAMVKRPTPELFAEIIAEEMLTAPCDPNNEIVRNVFREIYSAMNDTWRRGYECGLRTQQKDAARKGDEDGKE